MVARAALAAASALFFAMWIVSHWTYTSLGIDREELEPGGTVLSRYERVRWPGDGSLWVGRGHWRESADPARRLDGFDLGGAFFRPPRRTEARSAWNRFGFWHVGCEQGAAGPSEACWVGVPGWLPALLLAGLAAGLLRGRPKIDARRAPRTPPRGAT
jgi:hypothetical protein